MLDDLLARWRKSSMSLPDRTIAEKLAELTKFHHEFLKIHPFSDGNGRIARFLLAQQAKELLGIERRVIVEDRSPYFEALQKADAGDYEPLKSAITQAIYGVEFVTHRRAAAAGDICVGCNNGTIGLTQDSEAVQCSYCGATYVARENAV
jgi:fido (protein-threonine AMPylation protein)